MTQRRQRFSERIGAVVVPIQVRSMNATLRSSIWNLLRDCIQNEQPRVSQVVEALTKVALRVPLENIDRQVPRHWLYEQVEGMEWYQVYDLLEAFADRANAFTYNRVSRQTFYELANRVLADENAGYRFVAGRLTEITSPAEIAAIEEALAG